ncbi:MAG: hypothetical protein K0M63_11550 [Weeksellaceae bacterium]|nr:hypothetical protein [Weeksellaceae bacterium]
MFTKIIESYSFFKIVLSPLLIGIILGFALYQYFEQDQTGTVLFAVCILLGLIIGIIWAVRVTRKYGAHRFISRVDASEDIDRALNKNK